MDEMMAPKAPAPKKVKTDHLAAAAICVEPGSAAESSISFNIGQIRPMTWELIRKAIAAHLPGSKGKNSPAIWSRQALGKHDKIKKAYDNRKRELALQQTRGGKKPRSKSPDTRLLHEMIEAKDIQIGELQNRIVLLEDKNRTILINQILGATTEEELLVPLSTKIDRRPTDKPKKQPKDKK